MFMYIIYIYNLYICTYISIYQFMIKFILHRKFYNRFENMHKYSLRLINCMQRYEKVINLKSTNVLITYIFWHDCQLVFLKNNVTYSLNME